MGLLFSHRSRGKLAAQGGPLVRRRRIYELSHRPLHELHFHQPRWAGQGRRNHPDQPDLVRNHGSFFSRRGLRLGGGLRNPFNYVRLYSPGFGRRRHAEEHSVPLLPCSRLGGFVPGSRPLFLEIRFFLASLGLGGHGRIHLNGATTTACYPSLHEGGYPALRELRPTLFVILGGATNALAGVLFLSAIKNGKLVEVIPINRLSVLLIIFFSWFFFRKQEVISWRVIFGGILSVMGAWIIVSI